METNKQSSLGPALIIFAALLWAFDGLIRQHLYTLPPITIIFLEHIIGFLILFPFVWKHVAKATFTKKEWILVTVIAVLSGLLGTLWFTTALVKVHFISLSVVFLLQKLQPIFAISTAVIFLKEKFDTRYIKWAVLAVLAAYFVTFRNGIVDFKTGEGTIIAALYALGAAFAWGSSTTFSKMLLNKVSSEASLFYRFLFTIIIALPLVIGFGYGSTVTAVTPTQLGLLILISLSTGMVGMFVYYKGLSKVPVHVSTILELTFPFVAILIDMVVNHSFLSMSQWVAAIILVFAIYKVARLRESNQDTLVNVS